MCNQNAYYPFPQVGEEPGNLSILFFNSCELFFIFTNSAKPRQYPYEIISEKQKTNGYEMLFYINFRLDFK